MKQFLAIYTGSPHNKWEQLSQEEQKVRGEKGMKAWGAWMEKYKKDVLVPGGPLGKTKLVNEKGISDIKNAMTGYVLIQAESHEAAAKMFLEHPHFSIFPGDGVEIMECTKIPGM